MLKVLRLSVSIIFFLPLLIAIATLVLAFFALEQEPLVSQHTPVDYQTVAAGKALLKRLNRQIESAADVGATLAVTEDELGYLAQMGTHTFQRINMDIDLGSTTIDARLSLHLLPNPMGEYLNLAFRIGQSTGGLGIDRLSVGQLDLPGRWLLPLLARTADVLLPDQQPSLLLASVRSFRIEDTTALFEVQPPPDAKAQLKQVVKTLQASRFPRGEQERVVHYYEILTRLGVREPGRSMSDYLAPLMVEAVKRRDTSSAVVENRAVIWALTVYFSYGGIETLVGDLVSSERDLVRPARGVTLGARWDLMAHFLYSAGITLATQQGIGIAAGEFKELLDSGGGGSGFSFPDLAADRAGVRFATEATASESSARQLQQVIVENVGEGVFFPSVSGLPEGLREKQFQKEYGSTQSETYRKQVALIDQRINRLLAYSAHGG